MSPHVEERESNLEQWLNTFLEAGLELAALAVVRRGEVSVSEACEHVELFTVGIMKVEERRMSDLLESLERNRYVELREGKYRITLAGKEHMYTMLKKWNTYVDAMNNLWGCYYAS